MTDKAKPGKKPWWYVLLAVLAALAAPTYLVTNLVLAVVEAYQPCVSPSTGTWPPTAARTETFIDLPLTAADMPRTFPGPDEESVIAAVYRTPDEKKVQVWRRHPKHTDPDASLDEELQQSGSKSVRDGYRTKSTDACAEGIVAMSTGPLGGAAACYPSQFRDAKTRIYEPGAVCLFFDRWSGAKLEGPDMTVSELAELMPRLRPAIQVPRTP
ncbi:hypothetical protein ACFY3V_32365 [Streptosporangium sp. NPDC000095]|uniref:hypothetical protein n=1 Tax=Streptosporangium sp. NPDC000095 TaxID=3366184 RepID=UPI0036B3275E